MSPYCEVFVCFLCVLALPFPGVVHGILSERQVLIQFKEMMVDKEGSMRMWGIGDEEEPCITGYSWDGITCGNDTDGNPRVLEIDLHSQGLRGPIPESLVDLQFLSVLDLSDNFLFGPIPQNIRDFENLVSLNLADNRLTGSIPELPPFLRGLELQNNLLTGEINLTHAFNSSLRRCNLQNNQLTGGFPEDFTETKFARGGLTSPRWFDFSRNLLSGELPPGIGDMFYMDKFDISHNLFTGTLPDGEWIYQYIDISDNLFSGALPPRILVGKNYVNCSLNSFSGRIDLSQYVSTFQEVGTRYADLSVNDLEGPVPSEMAVSSLEIISLRWNRFSGNLDNFLAKNLSSLRELRVGNNQLAVGSGLKLIEGSASSNKPFSLPRIQVLDLARSGVNGTIPSEVFRRVNMPLLEVLDLSGNFLGGSIPSEVYHLPKLRELRLGNNFLQEQIDVSGTWRNLETLDIGNNSLSYNDTQLETILNNFTDLRVLRLGSNTGLETRIPTTIASLPLLQELDLSDCNLTGSIPNLLCRQDLLPSLKVLDLSANALDGSLPAACGAMSTLTQLNVSFNRLSGSLPPFQFRLFDKSNFIGNEELCGPPLDQCRTKTKNLKSWTVLVIVICSVLVSGFGCLLLGSWWRSSKETRRHQQDVELIAALLDRDTTTLMSLRELRKATGDFSEQNEIGAGGFGVVYRGFLEDGTEVAIKKSKRDASSSEEKRQFLNEVKILSHVSHRNLVRLLGCCLAHKNALLVFEYVPNGTLEEHLHGKQTTLTWRQRMIIAIQTAGALDYLHSSAYTPIYHLDVKSANILLDFNLNAKVADFGISRLAPASDATHITTLLGLQGTFGYMDPELVVKSTLTGKSDVYAFGVVLLELITAKSAVDRNRGEHVSLVNWAQSFMQMQRMHELIDSAILDTYHTPEGKQSIEEVLQLARTCLQFQSEDRPNMKEVVRDLLFIQQKCGLQILTSKNQQSPLESHLPERGFSV